MDDDSVILSTGQLNEEDTFKILISTDNHLGVYDSNPLLEHDSFNSFEEVLQIAQREKVDFVLLGGDLFHENKPKPSTFQRTVDLLQAYCLGSKAVEFEYLSDPAVDFRGKKNPCVNYYNPDINIGLPIFMIHGNHDDPIGVRKTSVIDHLAAANLVNHFGAWTDLNEIKIRPILLRKGNTKLALYGLGNVKDQRLNRLMRIHKVGFERPEEFKEDWFNIFVLHQNRARHSANNYIPESFIPDYMDLIIWGHEHESRPDAESVTVFGGKEGYVIQPGSTVATQLQPGEAVDKHAILLEVNGKQFKTTNFKLKTVRPFIIGDLPVSRVIQNLPKNRDAAREIEKYVEARVNDMISDANEKLTGHPEQPIVPFVRLRLLHDTDHPVFNPNIFNQRFANTVANDEVVMVKKVSQKGGEGLDVGEMDLGDIQEMIMAEDENIDLGSHVEEIVEKYFLKEREKGEAGQYLQILSDKGLSEAVRGAAEKDDQGAIKVIIDSQIKKTIDHLLRKNVTEDTIDDEVEAFRNLRYANIDKEVQEARDALKNRKGKKADTSANGSMGDSDDANESMDVENEVEILDDDDDVSVTAGSSSGRGRGRGRGAGTSTRGRGRGSRGGSAAGESSSSRGTRGRGRGAKASSSSSGSRQMVQTTIKLSGRSATQQSNNTAGGIQFDSDSDE